MSSDGKTVTMHDIDLNAMEVLIVTLGESKSTSPDTYQEKIGKGRTKSRSHSLRSRFCDGSGLWLDYWQSQDREKVQGRDNRKFLKGGVDTESVNLITLLKILCPVESCQDLITLNNICGLSEFTRHLKRHKSSVVEQTRAQAIALLSRWSGMQAHGYSEVELPLGLYLPKRHDRMISLDSLDKRKEDRHYNVLKVHKQTTLMEFNKKPHSWLWWNESINFRRDKNEN